MPVTLPLGRLRLSVKTGHPGCSESREGAGQPYEFVGVAINVVKPGLAGRQYDKPRPAEPIGFQSRLPGVLP